MKTASVGRSAGYSGLFSTFRDQGRISSTQYYSVEPCGARIPGVTYFLLRKESDVLDMGEIVERTIVPSTVTMKIDVMVFVFVTVLSAQLGEAGSVREGFFIVGRFVVTVPNPHLSLSSHTFEHIPDAEQLDIAS